MRYLILLLALGGCTHTNNVKLANEMQTRPACVAVRDDAAWSDCMARFAPVRPTYAPTHLLMQDWK